MLNNHETFHQIAEAFLQTWREECRLLPARIDDLDDKNYLAFLARVDPSYAKIVESLSLNERREALKNVALAYAVAKAILKAHEILHQDK
jgi:hypothetical protein